MKPASPFTEIITFLYTHDLETTNHFYETVLGLPVVVDQKDCRVYKITAESYIGFCERLTAPRQPEGVTFTFCVEDVDGWAAYLKSQGVHFDTDPAKNDRYGIYNAFFRDPNGYQLEIQRFYDPKWMEE